MVKRAPPDFCSRSHSLLFPPSPFPSAEEKLRTVDPPDISRNGAESTLLARPRLAPKVSVTNKSSRIQMTARAKILWPRTEAAATKLEGFGLQATIVGSALRVPKPSDPAISCPVSYCASRRERSYAVYNCIERVIDIPQGKRGRLFSP